MNPLHHFVLLLTLTGLAVKVAGAEPAPADAKPSVQTLAWLAGEWSFERNGRVVTEVWMPPAGGTLLAMSRTVANGRTVEYEFLVVRQNPAGEIVLEAKPSGQAGATFPLRRVSATEVVFENAHHDFPQRISYTLRPDGSLLAAIEGQRNGQTRRVEFPYQRKKS